MNFNNKEAAVMTAISSLKALAQIVMESHNN
jgi:hypothetical protein